MASRVAQQLVKHAFRKSSQYGTEGIIGYGIGNALEKENENSKTNVTIIESVSSGQKGFAIMDIVGIVIIIFFILTAMIFYQASMHEKNPKNRNNFEMKQMNASSNQQQQAQQQVQQSPSPRI